MGARHFSQRFLTQFLNCWRYALKFYLTPPALTTGVKEINLPQVMKELKQPF